MKKCNHFAHAALLITIALSLSGCMQLDTHVKLNEDGTATITERLRFSRRLLDLSGKEGSENDIASLLKKEAAEERAKHFGKSCVLASHEIKDAEGGARESVAVYKIDDLNELHYVSPFAAYKDYAKNNTVKFHLYPIVETSWTGCDAGDVAVALRPLAPPKGEQRSNENEPLPSGPLPVDSQILRDLQPVLRDMLKDFKVRLTFESYAPIRFSQIGLRGKGAGTASIDFIHFSDKDLDKLGGSFLENEELMLDLSRGEFASKEIADHVRDWQHNLTLPVFQNWGSMFATYRNGDAIYFKPSPALFEKIFEGKTLNFGERNGGKRAANFDEIGFKPKN
ncbi:MAG TPA: hypothetical protein VKX17_20435 [Planctomycetota bacterium]|nr:hypothetical protein [Planctomycetota bacterium]